MLQKKRWAAYLVAALASGAGLLVAYALFGIYPFGKLTIVYSDMNNQYLDFHALLWRVLREGRSVLYSPLAGTGDSLIPLFAYYLMSPFSLLAALFPINRMHDALLLIMVLKVMCMAMGYVYFARGFLSRERNAGLLFAPCYALSGYVMSYACNIMWLDALILLPILLVQLKRLVYEGKWLGFCLWLALLFWTQFYIGYMVGVFLLLCFVCLAICRGGKQTFRRFLLFAGSALLAAGLCAVLLLPTALRLFDNSIHSTANQGSLAVFRVDTIWRLLSKVYFGTFDSIAGGHAQIYAGMCAALLLPSFFFNRGIGRRLRLCVAGLAAVLLLSFLLPRLTLAWSAFEFTAFFPFRFSFLFVLLLAYAANLNFVHRETLPTSILVGSFIMLSALLVLHPYRLFPSVDEGLQWVSLGLLAGYTLLMVLLQAKPSWGKALSLCLGLLMLCDMSANAYVTMRGILVMHPFMEREDLHTFEASRSALLAEMEQDTEQPFRYEEDAGRFNSSFLFGMPRMQYFNSTASGRFGDALKKLGYRYSGKIHSREGDTLAMDALFGIRYFMGDRYHMIDQKPNDYYVRLGENDRRILFENPYAFPLAFVASDDALSYSVEADEGGDQFEMQNHMLAALAGEEVEAFLPLSWESETYNLKAWEQEGAFQWYRPLDPDDTSSLWYTAIAELDGPIYAGMEVAPPTDTVHVLVKGHTVLDLKPLYANSTVYLGQYWPEEEASIYLYPEYGDMLLDFDGMYALDMNAISDVSDLFYGRQMTDVRWEDARIRGTVEAGEAEMLFLSVPYDVGWQAFVDGERVETGNALGMFLGVPLSPGVHAIDLRYVPSGLIPGACISVASWLALSVAVVVRCRRRRKSGHALESG